MMLSRSVDALPASGGWVYEPKLDGFRALPAVSGFSDVRSDSRRGKALDRYFPEIIAAAYALPAGLVLDGELVVPREGGVDFAALQQRLCAGHRRVADLAREAPARSVAERSWRTRRNRVDCAGVAGCEVLVHDDLDDVADGGTEQEARRAEDGHPAHTERGDHGDGHTT